MSKHTKAPWFYENGVILEVNGMQRHIAKMVPGGVNDEQFQANTRLVVTAPEILEMVESLFCDPEGSPCFKGSAGDKDYFRSVLKKARGEA